MSQDVFPTVLVVDDDRIQVTLIGSLLERAGFRVYTAPSGDHAIAAMKDAGQAITKISLLVTDLDMPGVNGRQLAADMLRRHPALKVLYVTGNADGLFAPGSLLGPNEAFLEKPVAPESLREAVNFLLHTP
jgi:two-component system, cell cycle sensor histidine kinase and response regulator CckA